MSDFGIMGISVSVQCNVSLFYPALIARLRVFCVRSDGVVATAGRAGDADGAAAAAAACRSATAT